MQLAEDHGYEIVERHIKPEELSDAQEIFVTGTAAEVTPVGEIDGMVIEVGDVTKTLMAATTNWSVKTRKICLSGLAFRVHKPTSPRLSPSVCWLRKFFWMRQNG